MASVRGHTRRVNGRTITVRSHSRKSRGRPGPVFQPYRAGRNVKRAIRSVRRHKKTAATGFLLLSVMEITGWMIGNMVGIVLTIVALVTLGVATFALSSAGTKWPNSQ